MSTIELLNVLRNHGGPALTTGLSDEVLVQFAERDERLSEAVREAHASFIQLLVDEPELLAMDEGPRFGKSRMALLTSTQMMR